MGGRIPINPSNVDVRRRGGGCGGGTERGHRGISYFVKLNRGELERRGSVNSVEFRAIISPFDTDVRFQREPLSRSYSTSASSISLSLSLLFSSLA